MHVHDLSLSLSAHLLNQLFGVSLVLGNSKPKEQPETPAAPEVEAGQISQGWLCQCPLLLTQHSKGSFLSTGCQVHLTKKAEVARER